MPPVHLCNQWDRVLTLEINQAWMAERLDKFENKIDWMEIKNEARHEELKTMFSTMKDYVDNKYVRKETFAVAVSVIWVIATLLGILAYVFNK